MIVAREDPVEVLILDLVEWLDVAPRGYDETMSAWRTSCPRLPVWEEAVDRGYVERRVDGTGTSRVAPSAAGLALLAARRGQPVL
jgi:D-3-phosphoglycerate dehydrogenase